MTLFTLPVLAEIIAAISQLIFIQKHGKCLKSVQSARNNVFLIQQQSFLGKQLLFHQKPAKQRKRFDELPDGCNEELIIGSGVKIEDI